MASTQTLYDETVAAYQAALVSQEYTIRGRELKRARLKDLLEAMKTLKVMLQEEENGGAMCTSIEVSDPG